MREMRQEHTELEMQLSMSRAEARCYGDALHLIDVALERTDGEPSHADLATLRMDELAEVRARLEETQKRLSKLRHQRDAARLRAADAEAASRSTGAENKRLRAVLQRIAAAASRVWELADLPPRSPADTAYLLAERDAVALLEAMDRSGESPDDSASGDVER